MSDFETKALVKEAIKEWMDEKYTELGRWTVRTIGVAAFGTIMYFIYGRVH